MAFCQVTVLICWSCSYVPVLITLVKFRPKIFSIFLLSFILAPCSNSFFFMEVGTAAGRLQISLSSNPAAETVSSPRGSIPLLMETNFSFARGGGVSKQPLSAYEQTLAPCRTSSKTWFELVLKNICCK